LQKQAARVRDSRRRVEANGALHAGSEVEMDGWFLNNGDLHGRCLHGSALSPIMDRWTLG